MNDIGYSGDIPFTIARPAADEGIFTVSRDREAVAGPGKLNDRIFSNTLVNDLTMWSKQGPLGKPSVNPDAAYAALARVTSVLQAGEAFVHESGGIEEVKAAVPAVIVVWFRLLRVEVVRIGPFIL